MLNRMPGIKLMDMKGPGGDDGRWTSPFRWLLCLIYTGIITVLSLLPSDSLDDIPMFMPHEDKVFHFVAYALLVWFCWWSMRLRGTGYVVRLFVIVFLAVAYGVLLEFMQELLQPGDRDMSFWDAIFNLGGALSAAFVLRIFTRDRGVSEVFLRQNDDH